MDPVHKIRAKCLAAAARVAHSPEDILRVALAFEVYTVGGHDLGMAFLRGVAQPQPAEAQQPAPLSSALDQHLDTMERLGDAQHDAVALPAPGTKPH